MIAEVKYQVGTYQGTMHVPCNEDDDNESIIAKVKRILFREGGKFYGIDVCYESYRVILEKNETEFDEENPALDALEAEIDELVYGPKDDFCF